MRGRTNLSGLGGELAINGDIISATVAENNILAGDFVEYKQIESVQELFTGIDLDVKRHIALSENTYIAHVGDYLRLIDLSENRVNIIYTLSSYVVNDFIKTDDNEFYAVCATPASLIKFSVEGNQIIVSQSVSTPSGEETGVTLFEHKDKIYTVYMEEYREESYSNRTYSLVIYFFDKETLQYQKKTKKEYASSSASIGYSFILNYIYTKENSVFLNSLQKNSNNNDIAICFTKLKIQDEDIEIEKKDELIYNNYQNFGYMNFLTLKDNYIFYVINTGSEAYLYKYNVDLDNQEQYNLSSYNIVINNGYTNRFCIIEPIYNTDKFIIDIQEFNDKNTGVFEFTASESIALISNVLSNTIDGTLNRIEAVLSNNDNIFSITDETKASVPRTEHMYSRAYAHSPNYDTLSEPLDKNYVTPYHGGAAIGVAKDTGEIGKTIEIYVPKVIEA